MRIFTLNAMYRTACPLSVAGCIYITGGVRGLSRARLASAPIRLSRLGVGVGSRVQYGKADLGSNLFIR